MISASPDGPATEALKAPGMQRIGALAKATRTSVETIRFYEREGLLPQAPRSDGNYRVYGGQYAERLGFIRHCRSLDMTLDEIRVLLTFKDSPNSHCADVNALLDEHIGHVAARIRGLQQLEVELRSLRAKCAEAQDAAHCGILGGLSNAANRAAPDRAGMPKSHVKGSHHHRRPAYGLPAERMGRGAGKAA